MQEEFLHLSLLLLLLLLLFVYYLKTLY